MDEQTSEGKQVHLTNAQTHLVQRMLLLLLLGAVASLCLGAMLITILR